MIRAVAFAVFVVAIASLLIALLAGCGSAGGNRDGYRQDCLNHGGTYTEYEYEVGGACSYTNTP